MGSVFQKVDLPEYCIRIAQTDFFVSFSILNKHILHVVISGDLAYQNVKQIFAVRNEIIAKYMPNETYAEYAGKQDVRNYASLDDAIPSLEAIIQKRNLSQQFITEDAWNATIREDVHAANQVVSGEVWASTYHGFFEIEHFDDIKKITLAVFSNSQFDHKKIVRIADYFEVKGGSMRFRFRFSALIRNILSKHQCSIKHHIIVGASWNVRASILFTQGFWGHKFTFCKNMAEAKLLLRSDPADLQLHPSKIDAEQDELVHIAGSLVWEPNKEIVAPPKSSFAPVYQALELLRRDLQEERQRNQDFVQMRMVHESQLEQALEQSRIAS